MVGVSVILYSIKGYETPVPPPVISCPTPLVWKTIIPGIATRQDVVDVLGNPDDKGKIRFDDDRTISYYAYNLEDGKIAEFTQHRVFFRPDGKVEWIEAIVADSDGDYHTVQEWTDRIGNTLDTVYFNNNLDWFAEFQYDFQSGPDQVLVCSECGLALLAIWSPEIEEQVNPPTQALTLRYPDAFSSTQPVMDLTGIVMMEFLFQPTTFDEYMEHYVYRVPYGLWDDYLVQTGR